MPIRLKLKTIFDIHRSEGTTVHNNIVISDGHSHSDLSKINVESMQRFTGKKSEDFSELYNETLDKVYEEYTKELEDRAALEIKERAKLEKKSLTIQIAQTLKDGDFELEEEASVKEKKAKKA